MVFPELIDTITILKPITGRSKALIEHLENLIVRTYTRGEPGVLRYELFHLIHSENLLHIIITYKNELARDNHRKNKFYNDTMNLIQDEFMAVVVLKETRYWPCKNFTKYAREGSELFECVKCGKKKEQNDGDAGVNKATQGIRFLTP